jgi:hypothetical protein
VIFIENAKDIWRLAFGVGIEETPIFIPHRRVLSVGVIVSTDARSLLN